MKYVGKVLLNNFMSFKGLKKKKIIKFITSKVSFMDFRRIKDYCIREKNFLLESSLWSIIHQFL